MVDFKFLEEKPSSVDSFGSGSHQKTADKISKLIQDDNGKVNLIGIEGELGSGKSTILKILEESFKKDVILKDKLIFIHFDMDMFQHGSTKASMIKVLRDKISEVITDDSSQNSIKKSTDKALGNLLEYKKTVNSALSGWTVGFICLSALSLRLLPSALKYIFEINSDWSFDWYKFAVVMLAISPVLYVIFLILRSWMSNHIPSLGDIFKRNSIDSIREHFEITKEVGSYELRKAFEAFNKVVQSKNKKLILIIDNIDRLTQDKTKEIWSDLDIFTSLASSSSCTVILPFSHKHMAKALEQDNSQIGDEYISKKVPVIFRCPPIITLNWREQLSRYFEECFGDDVNVREYPNLMSQLIELWIKPDKQITPRFIKKYMNDVYTLFLMNNDESDGQIIPIAAVYIIIHQYQQVSLKELLSNHAVTDNSDKQLDLNNKISKTQNLISKYVEVNEWLNATLALHYQTDVDTAKSEFIREPLIGNISTANTEEIYRLSTIRGFDKIFLDYIDEAYFDDYKNLICLFSLMADHNGKQEFIYKWLQEVDHRLTKIPSDNINENLVYDQIYIDAVKKLHIKHYNLALDGVHALYQAQLNDLSAFNDSMIDKDGEASKDIKIMIDNIYECSQMLKQAYQGYEKPPFLDRFNFSENNNSYLFTLYLYPNKDGCYQDWCYDINSFVVQSCDNALLVDFIIHLLEKSVDSDQNYVRNNLNLNHNQINKCTQKMIEKISPLFLNILDECPQGVAKTKYKKIDIDLNQNRGRLDFVLFPILDNKNNTHLLLLINDDISAINQEIRIKLEENNNFKSLQDKVNYFSPEYIVYLFLKGYLDPNHRNHRHYRSDENEIYENFYLKEARDSIDIKKLSYFLKFFDRFKEISDKLDSLAYFKDSICKALNLNLEANHFSSDFFDSKFPLNSEYDDIAPFLSEKSKINIIQSFCKTYASKEESEKRNMYQSFINSRNKFFKLMLENKQHSDVKKFLEDIFKFFFFEFYSPNVSFRYNRGNLKKLSDIENNLIQFWNTETVLKLDCGDLVRNTLDFLNEYRPNELLALEHDKIKSGLLFFSDKMLSELNASLNINFRNSDFSKEVKICYINHFHEHFKLDVASFSVQNIHECIEIINDTQMKPHQIEWVLKQDWQISKASNEDLSNALLKFYHRFKEEYVVAPLESQLKAVGLITDTVEDIE